MCFQSLLTAHHLTEPGDDSRTHSCLCLQSVLSCVHTVSRRGHGQWQRFKIQRITAPRYTCRGQLSWQRNKKNTLPWQRLTEITAGLLWENLARVLSKYWWRSRRWTLTACSCLQLIKASEHRQRTFYHLSLEVFAENNPHTQTANVRRKTTISAILYSSSQNSFSLLFKSLVFCT